MSEVAARFLCVALLPLLVCMAAEAQPLTPSINPSASPINVYQQPEKVAVRPKVADQRLVNIAFGATVNSGNTQSYAGNLGGRLGLIHDRHQLTVEALGTLGGAEQTYECPPDGVTIPEGEPVPTCEKLFWTSRSVIGRVRYDLFVSAMDALFLAVAPRRDRIPGLDLRLQNQIGYLRNLYFPIDAHRLWIELGYDFTYDNFGKPEEDAVRSTMLPTDRDDKFVHSARIFVGYTNRISPTASVSTGVETLLDFEEARNVRVGGLAELTSSITHAFKLGLQLRVLFDNLPEPLPKESDLIAAAQLVYTFDSLAGTLTSPCPPCDCTAQVQAARASCRAQEPLRQITP